MQPLAPLQGQTHLISAQARLSFSTPPPFFLGPSLAPAPAPASSSALLCLSLAASSLHTSVRSLYGFTVYVAENNRFARNVWPNDLFLGGGINSKYRALRLDLKRTAYGL